MILVYLSLVSALTASYDVYYKFIAESLNSKEAIYEALDVIAELKEKRFTEKLKSIFKETKDDKTKIKIIRTLGILEDFTYISTLYPFLEIKIPNIFDLPPKERIKAIMKENLKIEAIRVLGELKPKDIKITLIDLIKREKSGRAVDEAYLVLAKLSEKINLQMYLNALSDKEYIYRLRACEFFYEIHESSAIPGLIRCLNDWNQDVRIKAIQTLSNMKSEESLPHIKKLLYDKDPRIRASACEGLGYFSDKKHINDLKLKLSDENGYVRLCGACSLLQLGDESGIDIISLALSSNERDPKIKAIDTIRQTRYSKLLGKLKEMFEREENITIKLKLAQTIIEISSKR